MSAISILATVVIRLASYGGGATFDGGGIDVETYRPGWQGGAPKGVCTTTYDWRQETNAVTCVCRVKFVKDVDLQCVGLVWRVTAAETAGRDWRVDGKARPAPAAEFKNVWVDGGSARRFALPLPKGRTLEAEFPEKVAYTAQDGRKWGDTWFVRFGPALGSRHHPAGEELVYRVRFSSPEGVALDRPTPCTVKAGANWARLANRKDILPGSALDFSGQGLQDAPAGKYGWLRAAGGRFEFADRPGVAQRFYGVNLCFTANYPVHEDADLLVERLVRLGYNTLRVHHHDDLWAKRPDLRERLDYLIARAIGRGLYVTTDLYVSRGVTWKELGRDRAGGPSMQLYKSLVQADDAAYANWQAFAKEFLEHVNPYTRRAYRDEPGMPLLSLVNEGNLGMGFNADKATDPTLLGAWREFAGDPQAAKVPNPWANEKAKAFDAELNRRFVGKATAYLRGLGVKALLTNDNNGNRHGEGEGETPLYDYVDNHFYIDHPSFLETSWRLPSKCPNANPVKLGQPKLFARGYAKGASKPYAITEWNFSGPGRYRALGGILTGALAARDEWDALWRFAYSHSRDNWKDGPNQCPGYFDCATDPLSQASDRASVCLFLRGDADGGSVSTDPKTGAMTFVSPRTCGGFAEGDRFGAGALAAEVAGAPAAVWVSALDGKTVSESARLLVVHLTDVQGNGNVYSDATRRVLLKWGKGCLVEKGTARISLVHPGDLTAWALDTTGRRIREIPVRREGKRLLFDGSTDEGTIYYELAHCAMVPVQKREGP